MTKAKLLTGFTMAAFLAAVVLPAGAFAATDVTISGNGKDSTNKAKVKNVKKTKVTQANTSVITNTIDVKQNTGGNKANGNTGGNVMVESGKATATVTVHNMTGGNMYHWSEECGCFVPENTVDISGNGADSYNKVKIVNYDSTKVSQTNMAVISNTVKVNQTTGNNTANNNTNGEVNLTSGDADAEITVENTTGENVIGSM